MEHLLLRLLDLLRLALRESGTVHVFKELVFLGELILENLQLGVDLAIFVTQTVDLNFGVHVLLVEILARLQCHLRNLLLELGLNFIWRAKHVLWVALA